MSADTGQDRIKKFNLAGCHWKFGHVSEQSDKKQQLKMSWDFISLNYNVHSTKLAIQVHNFDQADLFLH